jgi:hypothetical protein
VAWGAQAVDSTSSTLASWALTRSAPAAAAVPG